MFYFADCITTDACTAREADYNETETRAKELKEAYTSPQKVWFN